LFTRPALLDKIKTKVPCVDWLNIASVFLKDHFEYSLIILFREMFCGVVTNYLVLMFSQS